MNVGWITRMSGYILNGKTGKTLKDLTFEKFKEEKAKTPKALYKHYPNIISNDGRNYSQETLETGKVFIADPQSFDDPYDCDFCFDDTVLKKDVIVQLAGECGITISIPKSEYGLLEDIVKSIRDKSNERIVNEVFSGYSTNPNISIYSAVIIAVKNNLAESDSDIVKQVEKTIANMVSVPVSAFKKLRIACFTDRNNSIPMWSFYSNSHNGFCIEIEIDQTNKGRLFPVIYSDERLDSNEFVRKILFNEKRHVDDNEIENSFMLTMLHKSMEWSSQNEWRLVLPPNQLVDGNPKDVGKIRKVFLGVKMPECERKKIIAICKGKGYECYEMKMQKDKYALSAEKIL